MVVMLRTYTLRTLIVAMVVLPSCISGAKVPPTLGTPSITSLPAAVRIARHLTSAPEGCPGPSPHPTKVARFVGPVVGESPVWGGLYARFDPKVNTYRDGEVARTKKGWALKVIWLIEPGTSTPVTLTGTNVATGEPVSFHIGGVAPVGPTTVLVLDPDHPAIPLQHGQWKEFPSELLFPSSGCYRLNASWADGAWEMGFGFGG